MRGRASGIVLLLSMALFFVAPAEEEFYTNQFADHTLHADEELTGSSLVGVIVGFTLMGIFWFFTVISIIIDEKNRHRDFNDLLTKDVQTMQQLNMSKENVDEEYRQKNAKKPVVAEEDKAAA